MLERTAGFYSTFQTCTLHHGVHAFDCQKLSGACHHTLWRDLQLKLFFMTFGSTTHSFFRQQLELFMPILLTCLRCVVSALVCKSQCAGELFIDKPTENSYRDMFAVSVEWLQKSTMCRIEEEVLGKADTPTCSTWTWDSASDTFNFTLLQRQAHGSSLIIKPRYTPCGQPLRKHKVVYTTVSMPTYGQLQVVISYKPDGHTVKNTSYFIRMPNYNEFVPFPPKRWTCKVPSSCGKGTRVVQPNPPAGSRYLPQHVDMPSISSQQAGVKTVAVHLLFNSHCPCWG